MPSFMSTPDLNIQYPDIPKTMLSVAAYQNQMSQNALNQFNLQQQVNLQNALKDYQPGMGMDQPSVKNAMMADPKVMWHIANMESLEQNRKQQEALRGAQTLKDNQAAYIQQMNMAGQLAGPLLNKTDADLPGGFQQAISTFNSLFPNHQYNIKTPDQFSSPQEMRSYLQDVYNTALPVMQQVQNAQGKYGPPVKTSTGEYMMPNYKTGALESTGQKFAVPQGQQMIKQGDDGKYYWIDRPQQQQPGDTSQPQPVQATPIEGIQGPIPNQSDEQLIRQALTDKFQRPPTAQEVLDEKLSRQKEVESAKLDTKTKDINIPSLAQAVFNGQDSVDSIKGSMGNPIGAKVRTEVLNQYPGFDFNKSEANARWQKSQKNQTTISQIEGVLPRIQALADQVTDLGNTDWNTINRVWNSVNKEFGKPQVTNFESNRNAIVQEVNTALSGSSTGSDLRINIELENLKSSRSPAQLVGAIRNLNEALLSRLDTQLSVPYPIEVVRGEKTKAQWDKEISQKYRSKFNTQQTKTAPQQQQQQPSQDFSQMSNDDLLKMLSQ